MVMTMMMLFAMIVNRVWRGVKRGFVCVLQMGDGGLVWRGGCWCWDETRDLEAKSKRNKKPLSFFIEKQAKSEMLTCSKKTTLTASQLNGWALKGGGIKGPLRDP